MIKNKARWAEPPYALTKKGSVPALCLVHVPFATVVQLDHTLLGFGSWAVRSLKFLSHGRYIGSPGEVMEQDTGPNKSSQLGSEQGSTRGRFLFLYFSKSFFTE